MVLEEKMDKVFEEINSLVDQIGVKLDERNKREGKIKPLTEKKNSHLHMMIETSLMNKIVNEAREKEISIAELVRRKLRENSQLDRIERKLDMISNTRL